MKINKLKKNNKKNEKWVEGTEQLLSYSHSEIQLGTHQ